MAFDKKDDFDSNAKDIEQFGIWVKKAPEDVSQNDSIFSEADNSVQPVDFSDSTSPLSDLSKPDFDNTPDINAADLTDDFIEEQEEISSESFENSDESTQTTFSAPVSHEVSSTFQDFQEEDSAENWEPLDDAPHYDYPSVENIEVPPLEVPSESELENSLKKPTIEETTESFDAIDLTDDSSFDEIEKNSSELSSNAFDDFIDSNNSDDSNNSENQTETLNLTEDVFGLADFGATPETEDIKTDVFSESITASPEFNDSIDNNITDDVQNVSDDINQFSLSEETPNVINNIEDDFDTMFETTLPEDNISENSSYDFSNPETDNFEQTDMTSFDKIDDDIENLSSADNTQAEKSEEIGLSIDDFISDDGEIDVSNEFGISSDEGFDVTDDFLSDLNAEFGGSAEEKTEILNEEPIDIDLEFDDQFVSEIQIDVSDTIDEESNFNEMFKDSTQTDSAVEDNFDEMFSSIQNESPDVSSSTETVTVDSGFDEVTEFDDFLSSDDIPSIQTENTNAKKAEKIDYDITVSQEDANITKTTTVEVSDDFETSESIPLYGTKIDTDGNKVAFIPQAEKEAAPAPIKATHEKSEDDDFYENLFADAENIGEPAIETVSKDETPLSTEDSIDSDIINEDEFTVPLISEDDFDIKLNDEADFDSPETSEISTDDTPLPLQEDSEESYISSIAKDDEISETSDILDNADILPDILSNEDNFSEITEDDDSLAEELLTEQDTYSSTENVENFDIPLDENSTLEDEIESEDESNFTDNDIELDFNDDLLLDNDEADVDGIEIPYIDDDTDEILETPPILDDFYFEEEAENVSISNNFDESVANEENNVCDASEKETSEKATNDYIIESLDENDKDFINAAELADNLAAEDNSDSLSTDSLSFGKFDNSTLEEENDELPSFDDINVVDDISYNELPSFDDITSDTTSDDFSDPELTDTEFSDEEIDTNLSFSNNLYDEEESKISDVSLYNSIIAGSVAEDEQEDQNESDKNLLDIAEKSEYTEHKEDERNMDFDEATQDSGILEQSAKGVPGLTSNISEAVLKEISNELSMLRSEISQLKQELSNVRLDSFVSNANTNKCVATEELDDTLDEESEIEYESPPVVPSESTGFFDGDVEDETIALSGDELSNILNTADFTEEYVDNTTEDSAQIISDDEVPTAPIMDFDETLEEPENLEIELHDIEDESDIEEINVPRIDDIIVDSDDSFVESTETETEDSISNDTIKYLEEEPNDEEIYDTPSEVQPTEDILDSEPEVTTEIVDDLDAPIEETEEVLLDSDEDDGPFSEVDETPTDAVFESEQWKDDDEAELPIDEDDTADVESVEDDADVESVRKKADQFADKDQKDLKEEIKAVLLYMDQLLENLPDEKIEEFAQSSYFETYKKLFKELGIS
ncbi:MAG: hypothetical protein GX297_00415 [Treponema sp.]|nr:hypothetical protein [Treponema sp.]